MNVLSAAIADNKGLFLNGKGGFLEQADGTPLCQIRKIRGMYYVQWEQLPSSSMATTAEPSQLAASGSPVRRPIKLSERPHITPGTVKEWHERLGHPGEEALNHLSDSVQGIDITDSPKQASSGKLSLNGKCPTCEISQSERQISRQKFKAGSQAFELIYWDLIYMVNKINKQRYISHLYYSYLKFHLGQALTSKSDVSELIINMI
ncbi:hypothetical protein BO99DRAFT_455038 [Aspergillus violaceofuscus CBS 115571]|uniref:Uncharacterized protein n=1 Tax=Aspergillus violaceofuscus (strain CBS 115571) TaxID=1450538 RepID=A0A2V5HA79_ASPV1|nr:hypothetical protein BO99DRAFT_455038 [Aspergillus violaceofuscus CBS 115571]